MKHSCLSRVRHGTGPAFRSLRAVIAIGLLLAVQSAVPAAAAAKSDGGHPLTRFTPGSTETIDHSALDRLLKSYVVAGADGINRVHYVKFREQGLGALKAYLLKLQRQDPTRLDADEHAAYFINLYNALTLDVMLEHYPLNSIKQVRLADASGARQDGPWKARLGTVNRQAITLDEIGAEILGPTLMKRDPSGHYLLNCLSIGCPNLLPDAITGDKLATQMRAAAAAFVRHPRGLSVSGGRAKSSSLYAWYEDDFGGPKGVVAHMIAVGGPEVADKLAGIATISDHDYDWSLADASQ